jgi:hypothetical protein
MKKIKNGKKNRARAVDYARFVKVWKTAKSVGEVAETLDIPAGTASTIAWRLRQKKVKLKRFPRRARQPIDANKLNRI